MTAISLPLDAFPAEVLRLAEEQHVTEYLPAMLDMTRRVFPGLSFQVVLDEDPEIPDERHIRFDVDTSAYNTTELFHARQQWLRELGEICPAPRVCIFRIAIR